LETGDLEVGSLASREANKAVGLSVSSRSFVPPVPVAVVSQS